MRDILQIGDVVVRMAPDVAYFVAAIIVGVVVGYWARS